MPLPIALKLLATPTARDGRPDGSQNVPGANGTGTSVMRSLLKLLPTPTANLGHRGRAYTYRGPNAQGGETLDETIRLLPTPTTMDARGSRGRRLDGTPYTETSGVTLTDAAYESAGVHTGPQSRDGKASSAGLLLNPYFVEWMMGAPQAWSDPDCLLSAMEFSSRPAGFAAGESSNTPSGEGAPRD